MAFKVWDWKEPGREVLKGKLTAKLNKIPPWGKRVYGFELDNGEVWHVWGTSVLVGLLAPLGFLTKVKIKYLGRGFEKPDDKFAKLLFEVEILDLPQRTKKADKVAKALAGLGTTRKKTQSNIKTPERAK